MSSSQPHTRVFLTGFMGSGKSSIAPMLARKLGWSFVDLDAELEAAHGMSVPEMFAGHGERWFREAESAMIANLRWRENIVVALGGGAYNSADNQAMLRQLGVTIWLDVPVAILAARLASSGQFRPLLQDAHGSMLQGEALTARVAALLNERRSKYENADIHCPHDGSGSRTALVRSLASMLAEHDVT